MTPKKYAVQFLKSISENQRKKIKTMLENGVDCYRGISESYNIQHDIFIAELKQII